MPFAVCRGAQPDLCKRVDNCRPSMLWVTMCAGCGQAVYNIPPLCTACPWAVHMVIHSMLAVIQRLHRSCPSLPALALGFPVRRKLQPALPLRRLRRVPPAGDIIENRNRSGGAAPRDKQVPYAGHPKRRNLSHDTDYFANQKI